MLVGKDVLIAVVFTRMFLIRTRISACMKGNGCVVYMLSLWDTDDTVES